MDTEVMVVEARGRDRDRGRGRGRGRGRDREEAVTCTSRRHQALEQLQWHHQCDPDAKDVDVVQVRWTHRGRGRGHNQRGWLAIHAW
jgi:hypothetical protein